MKHINNVMFDIMRGPAMCSDLDLSIVDDTKEGFSDVWVASIRIEGELAYGMHKDTLEVTDLQAFGADPEEAVKNLDAICSNEILEHVDNED